MEIGLVVFLTTLLIFYRSNGGYSRVVINRHCSLAQYKETYYRAFAHFETLFITTSKK